MYDEFPTQESISRRRSVRKAIRATKTMSSLEIPGLSKLAEPFVVFLFRKENVRILAELKRYVEAHPR